MSRSAMSVSISVDTRFHYELSKLGGNIVLDTVIDSLHMATMSYVQEAVPFLKDWEAVKRTLQQQHYGIIGGDCLSR